MSLTPGTHLGVYEVTAQIGEGGMGQVYRATDTKLKRQVAIKILPPALAADHDRLARFQREAEVLASLNHPHIAAIYGLEESAGMTALVMELVEGEDLSQRIARGRIPFDEALPIAKQIAEALEAAHERGIIHRDLKPANIKIRADGTVKVLDFGLAKAIDGGGQAGKAGEAGRDGLTQSPTITTPALTHAGMILGTAAYMAPEQARGKILDRRVDIWAFGCVLFEMLTGRRAFFGEDVADTLAAVVRAEPDWGLVPQGLSPTLLVFLKRSLQKDPKQRVADIRDLRLALDGAFDVAVSLPAPPPSRSARPAWIAFAAAAVVAVALLIPTLRQLREVPSEEPSLRLTGPVPANSQVGYLEMSPDGRRLVAGVYRDGKTQLHLRALDALEWQPLAGTDNARSPFWSPDSRFIGFFSDGILKVIPAAGGPARVLCSATGSGNGGSWSPSGVIVFANDRAQLQQVDAAGGTCAAVGEPNRLAQLPVFLPDGNHFFFVGEIRGDVSSRGVYLAALDNFTPRRVMADFSGIVYTPPLSGGHAHLLFLRDTMLMAQPFDDATLMAVGDPFPMASHATVTFTRPQVAASVSMKTLVYLTGQSNESQLTWFDRSGKTLGTVGPPAVRQNVALSPDGTAVLTNRRDTSGQFALWLYDVARGSENRLLPPGTQYSAPVWSANGRQVLFQMRTPTGQGFYQKDRDGGGQPALVSPLTATLFFASQLSPDGRFLVFTVVDPKTQADVWYVPWDAKLDFGKAVKFAGKDAVESQGQVSPDGKWMAYTSNESVPNEVYVRPFPDGPGVFKISSGGGREPRWNADGKQLYYVVRSPNGGDRQVLLATDVAADGRGELRAETPKKLFDFRDTGAAPQSNVFSYSPHPDGQRFLVNASVDEDEPTINVITNWQKTLSDRKAP